MSTYQFEVSFKGWFWFFEFNEESLLLELNGNMMGDWSCIRLANMKVLKISVIRRCHWKAYLSWIVMRICYEYYSLDKVLRKDVGSMKGQEKLGWRSHDRWYCNLSGDGEFRVKELRNFIDDKYLPSHTEATRWVKLVPIKVNIFVWRARRDCLPTMTNLEHRGVDLFPVCVEACLSLVEFRPPRMVDISGMANLVPFASISI
nr:RNA-directed DNA polymerase, eukaryota [Tanacetum cinerariifolium]